MEYYRNGQAKSILYAEEPKDHCAAINVHLMSKKKRKKKH